MNLNAKKDIAGICSSLCAGGYSVKLKGFSAIDKYLGLPPLSFCWAETSADIAVLARIIENLRFPGVDLADCAAEASDGTCYFRCPDIDEQSRDTFPLLSFGYDWQRRRFLDPLGVYPLLRELRDKREQFLEGDRSDAGFFREGILNQTTLRTSAGSYRAIMDAALLLARYRTGCAAPPGISRCSG